MKRITFRFKDDEVHKKFMHKALDHNLSFQEFVEITVEDFIKERKCNWETMYSDGLVSKNEDGNWFILDNDNKWWEIEYCPSCGSVLDYSGCTEVI